mmetsp:Transcript_11951/g.18465  ORF Transcript_11951/g.18465 Transcript_11951/m.18465 type:complete len:118 (-) Transcript_11951:1517-1870(-)
MLMNVRAVQEQSDVPMNPVPSFPSLPPTSEQLPARPRAEEVEARQSRIEIAQQENQNQNMNNNNRMVFRSNSRHISPVEQYRIPQTGEPQRPEEGPRQEQIPSPPEEEAPATTVIAS